MTLDWFYSTIAQIFAAIFALSGVFVIYRLQDQRSKIRDAVDDALDILGSRLHMALGRRTITHVLDILGKEIALRKKEHLNHTEAETLPLLEEVRDKIVDLQAGEQWAKKLIAIPFATMFLMMALSICLLAFHRQLGYAIFGSILFWIVLTLSLLVMFAVTRMIFKMIYSEKDEVRSGVTFKGIYKLAGSWQHLFGALIAAFGTFIIFSPNIAPAVKIYENVIPYFGNMKAGIQKLEDFRYEASEPDKRQREKSLPKGQRGFNEVLHILRAINGDKLKGKEALEITNRRDGTYLEGTGEHLDLFNLVHVRVAEDVISYKLITTDQNLKLFAAMDRNRWIEGVGAAFVILGIFFPYLWQGIIFICERSTTKIKRITA